MIVRKFSEAKPYEAPNHRGYKSFRVYGAEMGGSQTLVFGISHFLPGGGAFEDATPVEKVYLVLDGEVTVTTADGEATLKKYDSCYLAPNESRSIENKTNSPASMLVAIPYPEPRDV